jgi:hypothetical protein
MDPFLGRICFVVLFFAFSRDNPLGFFLFPLHTMNLCPFFSLLLAGLRILRKLK